MRIKEGFELINRDGQHWVTALGNPSKDFAVSEYSAFLWNLLKKKEVTKSQMLDSLLSEFDISTVLALGEIDNFLRMMRENEVIE